MYPDKDIPVLQISIPIPRNPEDLWKIGQIIRGFREEDVLILGSGGITHNLRLAMRNYADGKENIKPDSWAKEFDSWIANVLAEGAFQSVLRASQHPLFKMAAPTTEHFDPIHLVLGTLSPKEGIKTIHEEIKFGNLSMRSFVSEA